MSINNPRSGVNVPSTAAGTPHDRYRRASELASAGDRAEARRLYAELNDEGAVPQSLRALALNDRAVIDWIEGSCDEARRGFLAAVELDANCTAARRNLELIGDVATQNRATKSSRRTRIAIVSLLFNWPSTGGGTVHTAETGMFLSRAGYDVRHFYAQYSDWEMGRVDEQLLYPAEPIHFDCNDWNADGIRDRFRAAVDTFGPDWVIITDSWNTKPLLAEAVRGYRYLLRLAALECLCPLNNVRLLVGDDGEIAACPRHQLATADLCRECVTRNHRNSGALHQAERSLAGFGEPVYAERLRRAFADAEAVLAVNPLVATMVSPYARSVKVVPSGFDPDRFPWPFPESEPQDSGCKQIFFAGLVDEHMKGFHVLQEAADQLWRKRQDFEIVATADPPGRVNQFIRYIGWQTQHDLPWAIRAADMLAFPTVAEEALGRTAVEAMGVGRPVVASRIGGLQFTVADGATGLLFEPGNAADLAAKLQRLLDDRELCRRLGATGRRRFDEHFTWKAIIDRHYRPLLGAPLSTQASRSLNLIERGRP